MYQFNLCNNDIIIILVLFFVFCVFLYMTNTKKRENFNNDVPFENTNKNKQNTKTSFNTFFKKMIVSTNALQSMNNNYINILDNFNKDKDNDIVIGTYIDNIKTNLGPDIHISKFDSNYLSPIEKEFNKLINNVNELFNEHKKLFNDSGDDGDGDGDGDGSDSYKTNCKTHDIEDTNFISNLNNHLDVIESKNISQLKLIKINIDDIKSIINKLNFKEVYRTELLKVFDNYYNLLNVMYNKNSTNIFNIINEKINNCSLESNYDKSKLFINQQNLKLIIKSFEKLEGEFEYFELDKLFITTHSANKHFTETKAGLKLWQSFCEKLKKLNKPNKTNLILKKFNLDLIEKKKKYIQQLEENIFNIQNNMTKNELQQYDINRIRTHEQAKKQYEAIKKGIDNIKNKNKLKINLT